MAEVHWVALGMSGDSPTGCSMPMGNIEIIEDVEALEDGFKACRLLGGCCFVKADSDETGRRSDISGQT